MPDPKPSKEEKIPIDEIVASFKPDEKLIIDSVEIIADTDRCKMAVDAFLEAVRGDLPTEAHRYRHMAHAMGLLKPRVRELTELARNTRHDAVRRVRVAMKEARRIAHEQRAKVRAAAREENPKL